MNIPGRSCPIEYSISQDIFKNDDFQADTVYIIGGLYGNFYALNKIKELSEEEKNVKLIFNGDIHWFDKDLEDFSKIEKEIKNDVKLLGNVEYELARNNNSDLGCGCAYPENVDNETVERSNIIHSIMKSNIVENKNILNELSNRKKSIVISILGKRIAITHGDEKSLSGWGCSKENLMTEKRRNELNNWFNENNIDVIASTHTCSPVAISLKYFNKNHSDKVVINNGAAGMPNYANTNFGIITRISSVINDNAICRYKMDNIYIESIPVHYDNKAFTEWFDKVWDAQSPASISYRNRIVNGGCETISKSIFGFEIF